MLWNKKAKAPIRVSFDVEPTRENKNAAPCHEEEPHKGETQSPRSGYSFNHNVDMFGIVRVNSELELKTLTGYSCDRHESVSIIFMDICGFTSWCDRTIDPESVIRALSALFQLFDEHCDELGVVKVETVGDSYMAVVGAHEYVQDHASVALEFAIRIHELQRVTKNIFGEAMRFRIGIHTGSCVSGAIKSTRPRWQLFGDTVNTASRMESTCPPGNIRISDPTYQLILRDQSADRARFKRQLPFTQSVINVKGKGDMITHVLDGDSDVRRRSVRKRRNSLIGSNITPVNSEDRQAIIIGKLPDVIIAQTKLLERTCENVPFTVYNPNECCVMTVVGLPPTGGGLALIHNDLENFSLLKLYLSEHNWKVVVVDTLGGEPCADSDVISNVKENLERVYIDFFIKRRSLDAAVPSTK